jgi:hypothetical protein
VTMGLALPSRSVTPTELEFHELDAYGLTGGVVVLFYLEGGKKRVLSASLRQKAVATPRPN